MQRIAIPFKRLSAGAALLAFLGLSSGCSNVYVPGFVKVYEPDIQQGNIIEPEQIERLEEGMPRTQVRNLLGTPALTDLFRGQQRDVYYYYDKRGKEEPFTHVLTLHYDQASRVTEIQSRGDDFAKAPSMNTAELPEPAELRETDPTVPLGETTPDERPPMPPRQPTGGEPAPSGAPDGGIPTTPGGL